MTTETTYLSDAANTDSDISPGALVGIVLACIATVVVATIIIFMYRRRKRSEDSTVRVWQENSVHPLPDLTKTRSTWHEGDEELGQAETRNFNPDLEFQPVNFVRGPSLFMNSDDDSSVFDDSTQLSSKQADNKETVVFDPKQKSFKVQNSENRNGVNATHRETDENITRGQDSSQIDSGERINSAQNSQVRKMQRSLETTASENDDYDLAKNINTADNSDGDQYVAMTNQDIELDTVVTENENEVNNQAEEDDVYNNFETIQGVRSVNSSRETLSNNLSSTRVVSDTGKLGAKPPKPLPRLSMKKLLDNEEHGPRQSLTERQVDTFMKAELPPGYDYVDEDVFIANRENKIKAESEDNVYVVPKFCNTNTDDKGVDDDSSDTDDSDENVYDVPRMRENQRNVTN